MARPETLVPGNCYFSVGFYDDDCRLPMIETVLYVGEDVGADGERLWVFRHPEAPLGPDEVGIDAEPLPLLGVPDAALHGVVDFHGLSEWLREVGVDHPLTPVPHRADEPARAEDFASVPGAIAAFMADPDCIGLTMTIRFEAKGLSVSRLGRGYYSLSVHTRPRRDPEEASRMLSLFAQRGVQPEADHLCDGGRTRALHFPMPSDVETMADVCVRALADVYAMRRGDVLDFHYLRRDDVPAAPY